MTNCRLLVALTALMVAFCAHAFFEELLLPRNPGPDDFHFPAFLQFFSHLSNILFAAAVIAASGIPWRCPPFRYVSLSVLQSLSQMCGSYAPRYMNYPTLQLVKAAKPIAVLVVQCVATSTRPSTRRLLIVTLISLGLAIFCYTDRCRDFSVIGLCLGSGILFFDGMASPLVDHLKEWRGPFIVMLYTQAWNLLMVTLLSCRQILAGFVWVHAHPEIVPRILVYEAAGSIGQVALFCALATTDGLSVAIATTLRKFFTLVLSAICFHHKLRLGQWVGVAVVFSPLVLDICWPRKNGALPVHSKQLR
jgi:UDP-galactose transporter B1